MKDVIILGAGLMGGKLRTIFSLAGDELVFVRLQANACYRELHFESKGEFVPFRDGRFFHTLFVG